MPNLTYLMLHKYILELFIKTQEVNELRILPADAQDWRNIVFGVHIEFVDGLHRTEHAVFVFVFVDTQLWLSWNQQPTLQVQYPFRFTTVQIQKPR